MICGWMGLNGTNLQCQISGRSRISSVEYPGGLAAMQALYLAKDALGDPV